MWLVEKTEKIYKIFQGLKPHLKIGSTSGPFAWSVSNSGGDWYVMESGQKCLSKLDQVMYERNGVSEDDIQGVVMNFIGKLLFEPDHATPEFLREQLQAVDDDIKQREVCMAIYGLEVESGLVFDFGKISFHAKDLERQAPEGPDSSRDVVYSWCCLTDEGTQLYMQNIAHPTMIEHVRAIEYLYNLYETDYPEDIAANFSLDWSPKNDSENMEISRIRGHHVFGRSSGRRPAHIRSVKISPEQLARWKEKSAYQKLDQLLRVDGEIKKRVMMALSFFHDSANEERSDYKILKSVIGIEALLGTAEDNHLGKIANSLGEKAAFLLETDLDKRLKVVKYIKDVYNLRSGIGHGRGAGIDEYDVWSAEIMCEEILMGVINAFLKLYNEESGFKSVNDIDVWYQKKKMA